ncbi:calcium/calmodulin-dependent protein kinase type IV [Orussus abietinus]|uniref:calcium/calmodulin-dependent protein kinase type IV n=1 Tax=Orussus abietinus TaxID=222816 RepID=UPI000625BD8B|nr:calcium/calmodulin-dependent protein kinase type IV [Orussus abietinus]XP_012281934.1 calcium/calmodulin-dependent protein kinase type IV [Orussus abietinus]XP_012281935.1 calcium/calmodulin-dependent protein kinase type IV [Orussus abietinus]XP_012281937.1 calcium/calmodulin-dependent protein kinase type IV [Orussus abietinus]XP_012281938.1 calcium/calmodulin-dependent protein kinase type IV [Orussus abietinus]XP_012281939.1 calcium/calmodulin-dependent protein kinase type IV [Orussus abie
MESDSDWLTGVSKGDFHDHYILGDVIGRGSVSTVCSCLYKGKKKYACKIIRKVQSSKVETRARIQTLLRIRHENIVSVREAYDDPQRLYLVEDLAAGGELLEKLASRGGYSEKDAADAVRDALSALRYLHEMGLHHGSVRPEKLLYATEDENSKLLLTDMGVAAPVINCYNALYCAPEVTSTRSSSSASDIWSLGVVIYIMLCGFEPFREMQEIFPAPYWDDKTDEAKHLITQLMQTNPEDRPTAQELLRDPWVRGVDTARHSMTDAAKKLCEFNARRKFKAATHVVRAAHRAIAFSHFHEEGT